MTEQILDRLIYQEYDHFIYAISGKGLVTPRDFGIIDCINISTACERGYYMVYSCDDGNLRLREMTVRTRDDNYSPINGFYKYRNMNELWTAMTYVGSKGVKSFTGGLIIGRNLRRGGGASHMGYWSACKTIIELKFNNGVVEKEIDCSDKLENFLNLSPNDIEGVFSLKYDFRYPNTLAHYKQ